MKKSGRMSGMLAGSMLILSTVFALEVAPTIQLLTVKEGQETPLKFTLLNNQDKDLTITPTCKDWRVLEQNKAFSANDWMIFPTEKFTLPKGQSQVFNVKILPPKGATGELIGMMSFEIDDGSESMVHSMMSQAVYVLIKGTEKFTPDISNLTVETSTAGTNVSFTCINSGNIHLRLSGSVQVFNKDEKLLIDEPISTGGPFYPGMGFNFKRTIGDRILKEGTYKLIIVADDTDRKLRAIDVKKILKVDSNKKVEIK
jgi:hypothetical protein